MSALDTILSEQKITHDLEQGSDAWLAFRLQHDGASEAAAVLGLSKSVTRNELLHAKHTGLPREFSDFVQERVLDKGHEVEALARPIVEAELGEDLYPVTCSRGRLSASCDGLTLDDGTAFEHKQWNEELAALVRQGIVPDEHQPQCQQIMLVTGAQRVKFVVSDGTAERMVSAFVTPDSTWWGRIAAAWEQFHIDLAAYVPPPATEPSPVGRAPETLPALRIEITGAVTASNLAEFKATALGAIRSVNRELATDQHFADAEQAVKWCSEIESRIKGAKEHALSQTATIDELFRTLDDVSAEARRVRLDLEKLVERRKVEIKTEMVTAARAVYERHEAAVRQEAGAWTLFQGPDFAAAIKGKRSVDAMRDALDTALANGKIKVDEAGRKIRAALGTLTEESKGFEHLFADRLSFISFSPEEVRSLVKARITEHQAAEQRRAAELAEKERDRIRKEEADKLQREQEARDREAARQAAEAAKPALTPAPAPAVIAEPAPVSQAAAANVVPLGTRAPAAEPATLKLGEINARLGFTMTAEFVATSLGITGQRERGAVLFKPSDYDRIRAALVQHIEHADHALAA